MKIKTILLACLCVILITILTPGLFNKLNAKIMSITTWGTLQKSLVDDETIEEAIARLIEEHNDDETAHLATGQSLQSHKASEIIDHLALSIVNDKILDGDLLLKKLSNTQKILMPSFFDMSDNTVTGIVASTLNGLTINTTGVNNNYSQIEMYSIGTTKLVQFSKDFMAQMTIKLTQNYSQTAYVMVGSTFLDDAFPGVGFKVVDDDMFAIYIDIDGVEHLSSALSGVVVTDENVCRIDYDASAETAYFYVGGVLKATITGLDDTEDSDMIFDFYMKTQSANEKQLYVYNIFTSFNTE